MNGAHIDFERWDRKISQPFVAYACLAGGQATILASQKGYPNDVVHDILAGRMTKIDAL